MAWRIAKHVIRGVLDNRQKGLVTGSVWLSGKATPVTIELRGNFLRDMAGCLLSFENPNPAAGDMNGMNGMQVGTTGDMTASRKVTVIDELTLDKDGQPIPPPESARRKANCLYLEWFSDTDGRIVIESVDYRVELSMPAWTMTADEEQSQASANREGFRLWLEQLSELEAAEPDEAPAQDDTKPLNEFEWEKILKDSDRKNERLNEVLDKYHGHPDSEKLIAREMGWTWVEEELEAQERGIFIDSDDDDFDDEDLEDDMAEVFIEDERDPDPLREGIDWVRDTDGSVEHPLALRALRFSTTVWNEFEREGLLEEAGDSRVFEWAGLVESIGVRLSNTLAEVAFADEIDHGYVVAGLKRSVHLVHEALNMIQTIEHLPVMTAEHLRHAQKTLFELRGDIIDLMKKHRSRQR